MIDSHAHLTFDRFDEDRDVVLRRAREAGVEAIINVGIDVSTSRESVALARAHEDIYAAVGVHPTTKVPSIEDELREIRRMALESRDVVAAIGEIGLDFYWKDVSPPDQIERLEKELEIAEELHLPVIVHCRDALGELLGHLESRGSVPEGVFHCFAGGTAEMERALRLGFHVSFAGNITYPRGTEDLRKAATAVPPERLLVETDAPFLPPQPVRGRRNEPAFLRHSLAFLADLRGVPEAELDETSTRAACELFRLRRRSPPPR